MSKRVSRRVRGARPIDSTAATAEVSIPGSFERSIALHRTTYTRPSDAWVASRRHRWDHLVRASRRARHVLRPNPGGDQKTAGGVDSGNATLVDRDSQWWAHRYVHNLAQMKYAYAVEDIRAAQAMWENEGAELVAAVDAKFGELFLGGVGRSAWDVRGSRGQSESRVVAPG